MNIRLAQRDLKTKFGPFTELLYYDGQAESIALVMGDVAAQENVLCRIHSACVGGHVFNSVECECADEMAAAQAAIQRAGKGLNVYPDQESKRNGHPRTKKSIPVKKTGHSQAEAYKMAGFEADARSFRPAAEILAELKVKSVVLLTNNPEKAADLRRASIEVAGTTAITA